MGCITEALGLETGAFLVDAFRGAMAEFEKTDRFANAVVLQAFRQYLTEVHHPVFVQGDLDGLVTVDGRQHRHAGVQALLDRPSGGTGFLGPHTVEYARKRGHEVTLFNRGKTNLGLFPDLETIIGDRDPDVDSGLSGLEGRQWDAVIDNSGYVPRITGASAGLLANDLNQDQLPISAVLVQDVSDGTLSLQADGSFTYDPDADFNGTDTFFPISSSRWMSGKVSTSLLKLT